MDKQNEKSQGSSHSSSRRTSDTLPKQFPPLPTPPPPRLGDGDNIFKFPPERKDLPPALQGLLDCAKQQEEFCNSLNEAIARDCLERHQSESSISVQSNDTSKSAHESQGCKFCAELRRECEHFIGPLHDHANASVTAALASFGAIEQLNRFYGLWEQFCDMEKELHNRQQCLKHVNSLNQRLREMQNVKDINDIKIELSDVDDEDFEQSMTLLENFLSKEHKTSSKGNAPKHQRGRSKSVLADEINLFGKQERESKYASARERILRRQSTYCEGGKSKVSKWTKVKAAFKWERANVPALNEASKDAPHGLMPINHEVARYLRVPSAPCGVSSSADSVLSSSSGHILSEAGTPGTISSASSMDEIDSNAHTLRRDSSKSDPKNADECDISPDYFKFENPPNKEQHKVAKSDSNKTLFLPYKSSSNKSIRKTRAVPDFEVLPEDVVADIKSTPTRRTKLPPSPLNLSLKQDFIDVDYYSPSLLKSPKDGTQSLHRSKKLSSPGNSSVPSSPSRHSDFFPEFESEDLSSGDFSEPTTPSRVSARKAYKQKQSEITQRYQILRAKLDMEFEAKRREWEKIKSPNSSRGLSFKCSPTSDEHSPKQAMNASLSAKLLEENLTPDFKKKLRKWRVKKQTSLSGPHCAAISPVSPSPADPKAKIDWNLWKTGQIKLEGQGLTPLPSQKDLPEEFRRKMEEWNKKKSCGYMACDIDSIKRSGKRSDAGKKGSDDDRAGAEKDKRADKHADKHKPHDKDKLEKLAKLKAIVTDHPAKEIKVKTSDGVMKFEGISRKFTRKLYEWEKARGIGPESSTFALLHPGYCPIDVGRIPKECQNAENSPSLSRSLSLDSISPNTTIPAILSHQASSLSLNDVNELKEMEGANGACPLVEPEAVMVEVEDHIEETASPLITAHNLVEQQTPVYKYEEMACNDYCNTRRVQSFESYTNVAPLLTALQRTAEVLLLLKKSSPDIRENIDVRRIEEILTIIRNVYPYYAENLMKPIVLNSIADVQAELGRISQLLERSPLDEACCQETLVERIKEYNEECKGLLDSLELLRKSIHGSTLRYPKDIVPDIHITADDAPEYTAKPICNTSSNEERLSTTVEATNSSSNTQSNEERVPSTVETTVELSGVPAEKTAENVINLHRTQSNGNGMSAAASKKKLRLRKMGSRQSSKTESDSSGEDTRSSIETPRRLKRKNFRCKQRSFDDDYRRAEADPSSISKVGEDITYILKVKPGHAIEQCENIGGIENGSLGKILITPTQSCVELRSVDADAPSSCDKHANHIADVFVKTKTKVFTTIEEPNSTDGVVVVEREVESSQPSDETNQTEATNAVGKKTAPENPRAPRFTGHKSKSLNDLPKLCFHAERRCHSYEMIKSKKKRDHNVRHPLACDSFKVINRHAGSAVKKVHSNDAVPDNQKRKEHLYKKNTDKQFGKFAGSTIKKIETKIAKTNSGSSVDQVSLQTPDKTDNTLPKISRKSLTPTLKQIQFEYPAPKSVPEETALSLDERPSTPISERAIRLQRAKEDFLQGMPRPKASHKRRDEIVRNDTWEQYRRSDQSLSSAVGEDGNLLKSMSVGTISQDTPTQSDAGTDQDVGVYDSLPRAVSRSGKISSKLGFATLASKFRRVKVKKNKEAPTSSALSALCRQTLLADVIAIPQMQALPPAERPPANTEYVKSAKESYV